MQNNNICKWLMKYTLFNLREMPTFRILGRVLYVYINKQIYEIPVSGRNDNDNGAW